MDYIDSKLVSKMPFQKRSFAGVLKRRGVSHKQLRKIPYEVCVLKGNLHTHEVDRGLSTHAEVPHLSSLPSDNGEVCAPQHKIMSTCQEPNDKL